MGPFWSISNRTLPLTCCRTAPPIAWLLGLQAHPGEEVISRDRGGIDNPKAHPPAAGCLPTGWSLSVVHNGAAGYREVR